MNDLEVYAAAAWQQEQQSFVENFPHPFFLLPAASRDGATSDGNGGWRFKTETMLRVTAGSDAKGASRPALLNKVLDCRVHAIKKSPHNPWRERISIGRASNNDIVLSEKSVSKLHAHLTFAADGKAWLNDVGSRNGTHVNDRVLRSAESVPLHVGDSVRFGRLTLTYIDAVSFYDFLRAQMRS